MGISAAPEDIYYRAGYIDPPAHLGQIGRVDRYELLAELGRGGMGVVYLARDADTNDRVALKILRPDLVGVRGAVYAFLEEAQLAGDLRHKFIAPVLRVLRRPAGPCIITPYYANGSLANLLKKDNPLSITEVYRLSFELASALGRMQRSNLTHGDVKPSNILLEGDELHVRLTDFGLARNLSTTLGLGDVQYDLRQGTAPYMSPQMVKGEGEGFGSDIYMFGATMYEMLTGRPPYEGDSKEDVYRQIRLGPPVKILDLRPDAPHALVRIIEKAMERNGEARYGSMWTILDDLSKVYDDTPSSWFSILPSRIVDRWRRVLLVSLILAALALLTAIGIRFRDRPISADVQPGLSLMRRINVPGVREWSAALAGDWDGDSAGDLYLGRDNGLMVVSTEGEVLMDQRLDMPSQAEVSLRLVGDIDRDKRDEAFLSWRSDGRMFIDVFTQSSFGVKRFTLDGTKLEDGLGVQHTTSLLPIALYDLDGDGNVELLAMLHAGPQGRPRGLGCFEFTSEAPVWSYLTAPNPEVVVVGDITGDGKAEIIVGTYAPNNGISLDNGTDDGHAYLYCLNHSGKLVWLKELGDRFTLVQPDLADLNADGTDDLLVGIIASAEFRSIEGERGLLLRLDDKGEVLGSYDLGARLCGFQVASLRSGQSPSIVAVDRLGQVHVLNANLSFQQKTRLPSPAGFEVVATIHAIEDLDQDGKSEILITAYGREVRESHVSGYKTVEFTHDHTLFVMNADMTIRAQYQLYDTRKAFPGIRLITSDLDHDGRKEIIVLTDEALVFALGS